MVGMNSVQPHGTKKEAGPRKIATYRGIDLHVASSSLYGVASSGEVVLSASAPNAWEALDVARQRCPGRIVAAVEAGCNGLLKPDNRRPPVRSLFGTTGHAWLAQVELPAPFRSTLNGPAGGRGRGVSANRGLRERGEDDVGTQPGRGGSGDDRPRGGFCGESFRPARRRSGVTAPGERRPWRSAFDP